MSNTFKIGKEYSIKYIEDLINRKSSDCTFSETKTSATIGGTWRHHVHGKTVESGTVFFSKIIKMERILFKIIRMENYVGEQAVEKGVHYTEAYLNTIPGIERRNECFVYTNDGKEIVLKEEDGNTGYYICQKKAMRL